MALATLKAESADVAKRKRKLAPEAQAWRDRLLAIRKRHGWNQGQAAELLGVSRRSWLAWEQGETIPSACWAKLIDILDKHPELFS